MKDKKTPLLGAHVSIAGGVSNAPIRANELFTNCFQLFTKNNNRWAGKKITPDESEKFKVVVSDGDFSGVAAHIDYLTNLASPKDTLWEKSKKGLREELQRCVALNIKMLVIHTTSHGGAGIEKGIERYSDGLREVLEGFGSDGKTGEENVMVKVLLETGAGQGNGIGTSFEELAAIIELTSKKTGFRDRFGICFDTCHAFAAGYDITTRKKYEEVMEDFDRVLGLENLKLFHLNDSKKGLGSRVDRHQHIGWGEMGIEPFRFIMNDKRFVEVPKIIETPKEKDYLTYDRINLDALLGLVEN